MYRLRRNDADCFAINDVTHFVRNDAIFALMCPQAHIISASDIIDEVNIICPKGKHHSKNKSTSEEVLLFLVPVAGL